MQEVMGSLQEVDLDDVRQILREPSEGTAVAVAYQDTSVAVVDLDTAVAVADAVADQGTAVAVLRRDVIKWATNNNIIYVW